MKQIETVIFDFDGTLVSNDTGYEFNKWLIKQSALRTILMLMFLPIAIPLIISSSTRILGLNICCYIATAFQSRSLFCLRSNFIKYYFNEGGASFYKDGIKELKMHQQNGRSIVIISGCPQWLLHGVCKHIGIKKAQLIGSTLQVSNGALLFTMHCYKENKLKMAKARGLNSKNWILCYSDSVADIPILKECRCKILVNVPPKKQKAFHLRIDEPIFTRAWK